MTNTEPTTPPSPYQGDRLVISLVAVALALPVLYGASVVGSGVVASAPTAAATAVPSESMADYISTMNQVIDHAVPGTTIGTELAAMGTTVSADQARWLASGGLAVVNGVTIRATEVAEGEHTFEYLGVPRQAG
jgi:hypothetical protein